MKATWRITDLAKRKIFWKGETTGYARIDSPTENGEKELVEKAFADSLRKSTYLRGFKETLASRRSREDIYADKKELVKISMLHEKAKNDAVKKIKDINGGIVPASSDWWGDGHNGWSGVDGWLGQIVIDKVPMFKKMTPAVMYKIRTGVVAVENKDGGIGSGLLLSPQLVLTADSVVDSYSNVKLTTINNRIDVGQPIRRHQKRDVALVYRKPTEFSPLPLRLELPEVGEEVYFALGAPTKELGEGVIDDAGVVTGYRYTDGGVEIMASTYVQENALGGALIDKRGNVIGMAHSGIRILPEETDYFIPIIDALQKLDVKVRGVTFAKKDINKEWIPVNQPSMETELPARAKNNSEKYKKAKEILVPEFEMLPKNIKKDTE
jgi:S1-C subfamily serine protease